MTEDPLKYLINITLTLALVGGIMKYVEYNQKKEAASAAAGVPAKSSSEVTQDKISAARNNVDSLLMTLDSNISGELGNLEYYQSLTNEVIFKRLNSPCWHGKSPADECLDPWGQPYTFAFMVEGKIRAGYGVYSFGPNRADENRSGDDIVAWKEVPIKIDYR